MGGLWPRASQKPRSGPDRGTPSGGSRARAAGGRACHGPGAGTPSRAAVAAVMRWGSWCARGYQPGRVSGGERVLPPEPGLHFTPHFKTLPTNQLQRTQLGLPATDVWANAGGPRLEASPGSRGQGVQAGVSSPATDPRLPASDSLGKMGQRSGGTGAHRPDHGLACSLAHSQDYPAPAPRTLNPKGKQEEKSLFIN